MSYMSSNCLRPCFLSLPLFTHFFPVRLFYSCWHTDNNLIPIGSIADPNPDPHVFGPPGSGSIGQRSGSGSGFGSGSGSFYHHAKIVRKTLIPTIFFLYFIFEK
jgi:hypothetical protein